MTKCIVHGCTNQTHEGMFVGELCGPCYIMLTTGQYNPSKAWFIQKIDELNSRIITLESTLSDVIFEALDPNGIDPRAKDWFIRIQQDLQQRELNGD